MTEAGAGDRQQLVCDQMSVILHARSIAIVGASAGDGTKLTSRPLKFLMKHGYAGKIFPINPKYTSIEGVTCYPSIMDVPDKIDLAAILLPYNRVLAIVDECGRKGVRGIVIFSSGFAETGSSGRALQEQLTALIRNYDMRVLGPNAAAVVNVDGHLTLSFVTGLMTDQLISGNMAFVSHSGASVSAALKLAEEKGFGFSYLVSLGNEVDVTATDLISFFVNDPRTNVISAFVEGIRDGRNLRCVAEAAAQKRKPIVMLKVGSSKRGEMVAASHTGAITGNDRAHSAVFKQLGIIRADDINDLIEISSVFARFRPSSQSDAAILGVGSGGAAGLLADLAGNRGVRLAEFPPDLHESLAQATTPFTILVNPIDIAGVTSDPNEEALLFRRCLEQLIKHPAIGIVGAVIPVVFYAVQVAQHIADLLPQTDKPILPILVGSTCFPECIEIFRRNGIPYFPSAEQGLKAVKAYQDYSDFLSHQASRRLPEGADATARPFPAPTPIAPSTEPGGLLSKGRTVLTLHSAADILRRYGFQLPPQGLASSAREARRIAREVGLPVVMKIESSKILHKTDVGGVCLGIRTLDDVERTFKALMKATERSVSAAEVDGILIQKMMKPHTEIILGCTRDQSFGHVILVGMGGVMVELLQDFSLRLPPIDSSEARRMIAETKAAKLLSGFRGGKAADKEALVRAIIDFSRLVEDFEPWLQEAEINPLFLMEEGGGAVVGDALFLIDPSAIGAADAGCATACSLGHRSATPVVTMQFELPR
jgi:acetyltransferase